MWPHEDCCSVKHREWSQQPRPSCLISQPCLAGSNLAPGVNRAASYSGPSMLGRVVRRLMMSTASCDRQRWIEWNLLVRPDRAS